MRANNFFLHCVHYLYHKCHKINFKWGGSKIDSPDWINYKKTTINLVNKRDNKCFQYAVTVALNHEEIGKYPERTTKLKPFIDKNDWKRMNYLLEKDNWKRFEKIIYPLLLMFCMLKMKKYILLMFKDITQIEKNKLFFGWLQTGKDGIILH